MPAIACLSEQQLRDLAAGAAQEHADAWGEHVEECQTCNEVYREWVANLQYVREIHGELNPQPPVSIRDSQWSRDDSIRVGVLESVPGYRIIREIHRGGQGIVYLAVQESTKRRVAVKVLREGPRWRFEREVEIVATFNHPNIVTIHDSGLSQGRYFYAMDYIRGLALDDYVRFKAAPVRSTMQLFTHICDAVSYAHDRGVIHRDLKPSNILVTDEGAPHLVDFGLAKVLNVASQREMATQSGNLLGTLHYMAPEQTAGNPQAITTRTDVYALGVILYEILTDTPPYETRVNLATAVRNITRTDPPRPSRRHKGINADLDKIVLKAMRKDPRERYGTAGELGQDIQAWLEGRLVMAGERSSFYLLYKLAVARPFESLVMTALLLSLVSFGAITADQYRRAQQATLERDQVAQTSARHQAAAGLAVAEAMPAMHDMYLPWFLLEWHQDRLAEAARIRDKVSPQRPELRAAMDFLLDQRQSVASLRSAVPAEAEPLVYFVAAEREWKAGRREEAMRHYHSSLSAAGNQKYRTLAAARLRQLQSNPGDGDLLSASRPEGQGAR